MSEPDIITEQTGKVTDELYAVAVEITRQGSGPSGWRISFPCAKDITLPDGTVITQQSGSMTFNFEDLAHDADVRDLYARLRDVTIRVLRGDLKAITNELP
jgi:hypothetical protein